MKSALRIVVLICLAFVCLNSAKAEMLKRDADLSAPDGLKLKVTYFSTGKPGPGVLLLHQCNRERSTWDDLATRLSQAGINVLTMDYRGYGESGGDPFSSQTPEQQAATQQKWPGDIDVAFQYLLAQPGVDRTQIGAGGASCGVDNSIQLARRHPEVKTLVLLSGATDDAGRAFPREVDEFARVHFRERGRWGDARVHALVNGLLARPAGQVGAL